MQELQAKAYCVDIQLSAIVFPQGFCRIRQTLDHKVKCAILRSPHIQVLDSSHKGDGSCVWVKIQIVKGPLVIASIYAPTNQHGARHIALWEWLHSFTPNAQCSILVFWGLSHDRFIGGFVWLFQLHPQDQSKGMERSG